MREKYKLQSHKQAKCYVEFVLTFSGVESVWFYSYDKPIVCIRKGKPISYNNQFVGAHQRHHLKWFF